MTETIVTKSQLTEIPIVRIRKLFIIINGLSGIKLGVIWTLGIQSLGVSVTCDLVIGIRLLGLELVGIW